MNTGQAIFHGTVDVGVVFKQQLGNGEVRGDHHQRVQSAAFLADSICVRVVFQQQLYNFNFAINNCQLHCGEPIVEDVVDIRPRNVLQQK